MTGLWARNCDTTQQALISKFAFWLEKLQGLFWELGPNCENATPSNCTSPLAY